MLKNMFVIKIKRKVVIQRRTKNKEYKYNNYYFIYIPN